MDSYPERNLLNAAIRLAKARKHYRNPSVKEGENNSVMSMLQHKVTIAEQYLDEMHKQYEVWKRIQARMRGEE